MGQAAIRIGLIGFSDSWGDLWLKEFKDQGAPMGLELVADERFARPDTSVTGQVLKLVSVKPDAVLVAASAAHPSASRRFHRALAVLRDLDRA